MQFLAGTILLVAFGLAFWLALPRDGKVRSFLRNDQAQAYYTVALIAVLGGGILNVVLGLMAMIGS
jgi:membrane protein YqaA with SNARE-associated domain